MMEVISVIVDDHTRRLNCIRHPKSVRLKNAYQIFENNALRIKPDNKFDSGQRDNVHRKCKRNSNNSKLGIVLYLLLSHWTPPVIGYNENLIKLRDDHVTDAGSSGNQMSDAFASRKNKSLADGKMMSGQFSDRGNVTPFYLQDQAQPDITQEEFQVVDINKRLRPPDLTRFKQKQVKFGVILPLDPKQEFSSRKALPLIELASKAVTDVNKGYLPGWDLQVIYRNSNCSSVDGPLAAFELYMNEQVDVFLGPGCDYVIAPVARYAGAWKVPVLTTGAHAEAFQHKNDNFETLTRMMGGYNKVGVAMKHIFQEFGWKTFEMMYHNTIGSSFKGNSVCYLTMASIHMALQEGAGKNFNMFDESKTTKSEYVKMLKKIMKNARIVVLCANPSTVREIMLAAEELNMVSSGEYVFFNIELFSSLTSPSSLIPWRVEGDSEERNMRAKNAYTAMLTVTTRTPEDDEYLQFSAKVKELAQTKYNYTFGNDSVTTFVTSFYDAVLLYAIALNETLEEIPGVITGETPLDASEIIRRMWGRTFKGITGDVTIDNNGDRVASYSLLDMHPESGKFEVVANYIAANGSLEYVPGRPIYWAGGRTEPPADTPVCGFDGSLCPDQSVPAYAILSIILALIMLFVGVFSFIFYRRYRLDTEIAMMTWRIHWIDVKENPPGKGNKGSLHSLTRRNSQATIYSEDNTSLPGERQAYMPSGFYKGSKVAIKKVERSRIELTRPLLLELKKMKDLQHDHLVRFYGACIDPPNCALITEYCPKGSLQDILENDQLQLDWMFKVSLMHDIARGMSFLHGTDIKSHGALKSSNCVVDSRFVLKIADFGLHGLKTIPSEEENQEAHSYWRRKLWTSPELLKMDLPPPEGTQKGDVYSFGIVIHEIVSRQGVFWIGNDFHYSPQEIIEFIKEGRCPTAVSLREEPLRPRIELVVYENERVADLMRRCWAENPSERPDFGQLKSLIRKLNKEHETGNIVDNLLNRMEQYANNLEAQVLERTAAYLDEKKKCEELLYQLLPKPVAAQLIRGQSVVAETYDQVTIYFSDIVGFTHLSAQSNPLEVVDLLNDLYTCFDSIVGGFDVYKVETIGDCYMVVSGLPVRNGNLHAREIARMSLALLDKIHKFVIRHRPNEQLKLRIGIHTGPCVAGVVGLKMPRYCLFGDTVNTASRMESNGEELKIHVSPSTKAILDTFGTFQLECRGQVTMKGKGTMTTYWLNGETPDPNEVKLIPYNNSSLGLHGDMNQSSLTPFRQRRDQHSRPNSRRGSACFATPQKTISDGDNHAYEPITNGIAVKESNSSHNLANNTKGMNGSQLTTSVSFNLSHPIINREKLAPGTPPLMPKNHKVGNNNWLPKLASQDAIEMGSGKINDKSQDFGVSVPLLASANDTSDSMV